MAKNLMSMMAQILSIKRPPWAKISIQQQEKEKTILEYDSWQVSMCIFALLEEGRGIKGKDYFKRQMTGQKRNIGS